MRTISGRVIDRHNPRVGIAGVPITLFSLKGVVIHSTTTDVDGRYRFTDIFYPGLTYVQALVRRPGREVIAPDLASTATSTSLRAPDVEVMFEHATGVPAIWPAERPRWPMGTTQGRPVESARARARRKGPATWPDGPGWSC